MSTYLYLVCLDHDPPLLAPDESGQHLYDLPRIQQEVRDREELVTKYENSTLRHYNVTRDIDDYFTRHSAAFLAQHRKCRIGIKDEYGQEHPCDQADSDES